MEDDLESSVEAASSARRLVVDDEDESQADWASMKQSLRWMIGGRRCDIPVNECLIVDIHAHASRVFNPRNRTDIHRE
jgi:hypothetical protein